MSPGMCANGHGMPQPRHRGLAAAQSGDLVLANPDELASDQLDKLQQIYEQAFPPHLRVPMAELAAATPRGRLLVALDQGEPVGFAAIRLLTGPQWVFLRYFGIAAGRRRTGVGLRLWQLLTESVVDLGWPARIALEAEDPAEAAGNPAEQEVRRGRIGFWARCGASALPVPRYAMPALTEIGSAEQMVLMVFDPGARSPGVADVSDLVQAIFTEHYGLAPLHPIVSAALASIGTGGG
jgi:Acetyltransferase (GNAT) family